MPEGKERLRHPFVTAAWATGGVLTCLLGVRLGRLLSLQRRVSASSMALKRWADLSGEGFQLQDVEALGDSELVRFSGAGTGFAVVSEGVEYYSDTRVAFAVRERAYGFAFTYDPGETRCLDPLIIVDGE